MMRVGKRTAVVVVLVVVVAVGFGMMKGVVAEQRQMALLPMVTIPIHSVRESVSCSSFLEQPLLRHKRWIDHVILVDLGPRTRVLMKGNVACFKGSTKEVMMDIAVVTCAVTGEYGK
jgi:hypothetical protein